MVLVVAIIKLKLRTNLFEDFTDKKEKGEKIITNGTTIVSTEYLRTRRTRYTNWTEHSFVAV